MHEMYLRYDNALQILGAERVTCDNSKQGLFRAKENHFHLPLAVLITMFHCDREFTAATCISGTELEILCCPAIFFTGNNKEFELAIAKILGKNSISSDYWYIDS